MSTAGRGGRTRMSGKQNAPTGLAPAPSQPTPVGDAEGAVKGASKGAAGRNFQREFGRRILFALLSRLGIALDNL